MNRLLSIIVSLVVLFFVYIWISHLSTSPKYTSDEEHKVRSDSQAEEQADNAEAIVAEPELTKDTVETADPPLTDTLEPSIQPQPEQTEVAKPVEKPKPAPSKVEKPVSPPRTGRHLVIAGNFLELANAEKHLARLRELGYKESEIVHFELSEYHTVCAGRFEDPVEARRVAKRITDSYGIDTYVRAINQ